jgi:peptidoglycan L-alanyl-D-glutamate endopeptidase CwlK
MDNSLVQIQTLHPKLRDTALLAYQQAVKATPAGVHPIITQGLRTFAESDHLYALGRTIVNPDGKSAAKPMGNIVTKAKAGQSYHNYGLAIDFALVINGATTWDQNNPNWITVVNIFKANGFTWGGDFNGSFKDYPHLEQKFGHTWQDLLVLYNGKKFIPGTTFVQI